MSESCSGTGLLFVWSSGRNPRHLAKEYWDGNHGGDFAAVTLSPTLQHEIFIFTLFGLKKAILLENIGRSYCVSHRSVSDKLCCSRLGGRRRGAQIAHSLREPQVPNWIVFWFRRDHTDPHTLREESRSGKEECRKAQSPRKHKLRQFRQFEIWSSVMNIWASFQASLARAPDWDWDVHFSMEGSRRIWLACRSFHSRLRSPTASRSEPRCQSSYLETSASNRLRDCKYACVRCVRARCSQEKHPFKASAHMLSTKTMP